MDVQLLRISIGVLLLLLIVLLPVRAASGSRWGFLGFGLGLVAAFATAALLLHLGDYVLDDDDEGIVKSQIGVMQRDQAAHLPKNLIFIEGSSLTELGIDGRAVEEQLHQAGYDVTVVELAGEGGNHLERYSMFKRLAGEITRHGLSLSPNTRILFEVTPGYDSAPARFFGGNTDSLRVYDYLSADNVVFTVKTLAMVNGGYDFKDVKQVAALSAQTLAKDLNIGLLPYMHRFDTLEDVQPFTPKRRPHFATARKPYDPEEFRRDPPEPLDDKWKSFAAYRTGRVEQLFGGGVTESDFFSVPTINGEEMLDYVRSFCAWRAPKPCIDASDPAIYGAVDSFDDYYNRDHLSAAGADIYTHYFVRQLIAQQVVVK